MADDRLLGHVCDGRDHHDDLSAVGVGQRRPSLAGITERSVPLAIARGALTTVRELLDAPARCRLTELRTRELEQRVQLLTEDRDRLLAVFDVLADDLRARVAEWTGTNAREAPRDA